MRIVLQRVSSASVSVSGETIASIGPGLLALVAVGEDDGEAEAQRLAVKTAELRLFPDEAGRFDRSLLECGYEALVVSQFTLYGSTRKGRRPSFNDAASPETAEPLVEAYARALEAQGVAVARGQFGAYMAVHLVNDGPVTLILDSADYDGPRRR